MSGTSQYWMQQDELFDRTRRNLVITSGIIIYINLTLANVTRINFLGLSVSGDHNVIAAFVCIYATLTYFLLRYLKYQKLCETNKLSVYNSELSLQLNVALNSVVLEHINCNDKYMPDIPLENISVDSVNSGSTDLYHDQQGYYVKLINNHNALAGIKKYRHLPYEEFVRQKHRIEDKLQSERPEFSELYWPYWLALGAYISLFYKLIHISFPFCQL